MRILITGAFGNIGKSVVEESLRRGHEVVVFDVESKKTRRDARKYREKIQRVVFGDVRDFDDVREAVGGCDGGYSLAAIIPPASKTRRELTMDVNYGAL